MKKSMLKSFFAKAALVLALSTPVLSTLSCDIGLGASVDVLAPSLTISYPPTGAIVMDKFKLAGECSDDVGVMSVQVTVKSTDTGVVVFSGNARVTLNNWEIDLNEKNDTLYPSTNGWQFADGTYEISAIASDNSGKNSGNISRTIEIDNTAPVFIIEKPGVTRQQIKLPASDSSHKDPSAYGTAFSVTGTIADLHSVSRMDLDIYDSDGNLIPGAQFTESSVSTAGGTEVSVARYIKGNRSSAEYKEYEAIYGQDPESVTSKENSEKQFYCTIRVADNAKIYQSKGDSGVGEGNVTSDVYLYNDVYTDYLSSKSGLGLSASDVMNILSGTATRSYEVSKETLLSLLCNTSEIDKTLAFTIDPIADPVYTVNGYDISPDFTTFPSGASQSSVSATAQSGKDGTLIRTNSLHLFVKKFGSVLNHDMASEFAGIVTTTAEKNHKKMIPGKKEYDADYTNLNYIEDMLHAIGGTGKITREEVASAINTYTFYVDESRTVFCLADTTSRSEGTDAKVTVNSIMPPSSVLADEYFLFALTGYDADYSEISQSNGYYGFKGEATGTPPETFIDEPLSLSFRKSSAASDLKFKGTMRRGDSPVERLDIEILVTDEEKNEVLNKENPIRGTITAAAGQIVEQGVSTGIYDWQFNPADLEGYDDLVKVESEGKSYLYDATLTGVGENSVTKIITRSVHIDSKKPIISFSSISPVVSGSVFDGSGNAYVNGKLTFKVNIDETNLSTDEDAVSFYIFTYDESGTPTNVTSTALGGRSNLKGKTLSFTETIDTKDLTDGAKLSIMVRARDKAGNVAEYLSDSYTDENKTSAGSKLIINQETDRPRISPNNFELNLPRDQIKINHNLFGITSNNTLSAIITDDDGVASVSAGWRPAGSDQKFSNFYSKSGMTSTTFSMNSTSFPFGAGEYEVQIEAKDTEGNPSGTLVLPINIAVSQGAPDLSIGTASGDFKAPGIEVEVKGTVSTDNQIISFKRLAAYGKQEKSVAIADNAWTDKFTSGTDQQNYVETYVATDKYGQIASREFRYKIDTLPPLAYGDSRVLIEDKAISVENFVFTGTSVDQGDATVNSGVRCLYYQVLPTSAATPSVDVADGWTIINATGTWKLPLEFVAYGTEINPAEATVKFAEGEYNLHVYAEDNAGNKSGVSSSRFDVKLSLPSVNDLVARNAGDDTVITKTKNDGFRYTYSVSDSYTPVPPTVEAKVFKNGVEYNTNITSDFTYPNGTVTVNGLSSDGTYRVEVVATDHFKKKSIMQKAEVIYDRTRPVTPVIIYPGETSQWFNKPTISVYGTADDNEGGVGLKYVYFANDETEPDHTDTTKWRSISFNNKEWKDSVDLTVEGSGTKMFIYSVDEVGNVSDTAFRTLNLDRTAPVVSDINFSNTEGQSGTFTGLASLEYSKLNTYTITGIVEDELCTAGIRISCDGQKIEDDPTKFRFTFTPVTGSDGKKGGTWTLVSNGMAEGQHIYSIYGFDEAGNETSEIRRTVVVDTKNPEIGSIGIPEVKERQNTFYVFSGLIGDGDKTSGIKEVKFSATGSNGKEKYYTVSGTQSWTSTVTFDSADPDSPFNAEGSVTIKVTATDNAGNESLMTKDFVYDKANPSLTPDAALPVGYMPMNGVVVSGLLEDSYKLKESNLLTVEETFTPVNGTEIKTVWKFSITDDDQINIKVTQAGTVLYNGNLSGLTSYIPAGKESDYYFKHAEGDNGANRKFRVSVRAPIKVHSTEHKVASPEDGVYAYKLFTYDSVGNQASLEPSTTLTADLTPPEVSVTKPTDRNTGVNAIVDQLYQFKGTSDDGNTVAKIMWQVAPSGTPTPNHGDSRFSDDIQGDVGNWTIPYTFKAKNDTASDATPEGIGYQLFIYAEDGATNKSDVQTIVFDVDFNAPKFDENATGFVKLESTKVLTETTTNDKNFRFEYKATDTHGLSGHPEVVVKFEDDSGSRTLDYPSEYTVVQNTPAPGDDYNRTGYVKINNTADGYYTFELTATDVVEKKTLIKKSIRLDTQAPKIEISTPAFDSSKKSDWEGNGDGKVNVIGSATDKTGVSGVYYKVASDASGASRPSGNLTDRSVWEDEEWKYAGTTNWKFNDANLDSGEYREGEFNISIAAVDTIGTVSAETYKLYVDKSNPVISNIEISTDNGTNWTAVSNSKATIAYNKYKLRGKFSDGNSVKASYNGTKYNSVKNETTKLYEGEFEITESTAVDDGIKNYVITATDAAGKDVRVEIAVTVDTTAPTVEFISPDFDDWQTGQNANGQVKVSGSASDDTTSVGAVWFKRGGGVVLPAGLTKENATDPATWTDDGWTYAGKTSWNVANANAGNEGETKVNFVAVDTCGNYTEVTTQNLKVDKGAPKIEGIKYTTVASPEESDWIDLPANGIITSKRYKIKGTYSDGTTTTVHNNEGKFTDITGLNGEWIIDESAADADEGKHEYTVTATDQASNVTAKTIAVTVDTVAPTLAVTSPNFEGDSSSDDYRKSDWQVVADKRVKLNGTASDDTSVKAIWYKVFASVPETVPELPSGDKTFDPTWTGWTKAKGTTSWSIADPSNSAKGPEFSEGSNYLYIATVDSNGNAQVATSPYNLRVDAGAPAAKDLQYRTFNKTADNGTEVWNDWTDYTSGVALNNKKFQLRGTFTDGTNINVTGPETGFTVTGNGTKNAEWVLSKEVADDGTYNYTVKATDQAGNEKEETISVRVDTTAPEIKITSHDFTKTNIGTADSPEYVYNSDYTSGTNNVTVLGSGDDPSGIKAIWYKTGNSAYIPNTITAESNWTTAGWTKVEGTVTNWKIPLTGLANGETKLSIAAIDNLNNVSKVVKALDKSAVDNDVEFINLLVDKEKPYINRSNAVESDVVVTQLDTVNKYSYLNDKGTGYSSKKFKLSGKVADAYKVASIEVKITGGTGDNAFDTTFYSDQTKTDKLVVTKTDSDRNWAWVTPAFVVGSAEAGTGEYKLSDANYTVTITGRDAGGQEVEITETIVIDTVVPEFTSEVTSTAKVKPAAGASEDDKKAFKYWYQSQVLNVLVKTTETGSGMDTVTYRVGNNDPIPLTADATKTEWTADATKTEWTAAVTMENTAGINDVRISAKDKAGNERIYDLTSYPGGDVKPFVDVVKPAIDNSLDKVKVKVGGDAEKTNVNSLLLNGKTTVELVVPVTDQGSGFAHDDNTATDIYITKFGKPVSGKALKGVRDASRGGYVFTIPANDGTNEYQKSGSIEIKAVDCCGNETSSTLLMQITVDETAPTVQITAPTYESHTVTKAESEDANSEYYGIAEGVVKIVNGKKDVRGTVDDTYADSIELWYTTTLEGSATGKKPYAGGEVVIDGDVTTAGTPEDFGWTKYEFTEDGNTVGTITDPSKVYNWNFKNLEFNNLSGADEAISSDGKKYTGIGKIYVLPVAKDKAGNSNAYTISLNPAGKTVYTWKLRDNATEYMVDMNRDRPVVQVTNITRKQVEEKKEDGSSYDPKKYKWVYNLKYGTNSQISGAISDDDAENGTVAREFRVSETQPTGRAGGASGTTWSGSDWTFQPEDINDGPKNVYFYIVDNNGTEFFTGNTKKPGTGRKESATSDLFQPYFQFKSEAKENNDSVITYNSDSNSPAVSSAQMWVYNNSDEFQKQPGYDGTDKPTFENISSTVIVGGEKYNKVEFDLTATDACGVAGFVLDITDSADTPNTVKLYTGEVPVDGIVKKDVRGVWVEDTATQKDPNSILYTDGKWYKSDYTRVAGFRVVDNTTSKWKTDKISMSQFATGEVNVKIDVYDNSELKGSGSNTFKVDNAGPAVTNIEPAANTPKSGNVDLSGYASDSERGGAGVDKVYYLIPTKEEAALSDAELKDLSWQDKSSSKSPWHFLFNGGTTTYDCPKLIEYSSTTYSSKDDQDYWTIPVFIKAVDVLGNYSITRHSVYYNPDGDRVVTGFTYPTEDNYDMDETTRLDYATLGSTIRISGTVNTADPESAARADGVYLQIVEASYKAKKALTLYKANAELKLIKDGTTNKFRKITDNENPELIFAKDSYLGADHIGNLAEGTDYIVVTKVANESLDSLQIAWHTTEDYEETFDFDDASAKDAAKEFELGDVCDADHVPGGKKNIAKFNTGNSGFATEEARNAWWGLATTNTASSWNISINANDKLNPAENTHVTRHFAVRASTINSYNKVGAWSTPVIYIHVDNAAPTISSIMCKFADGTFTAPGEITGDLPSPIATTSYKPGMFLKGLWYLVADVVDEGSIKSISENGVVISGTTTTMYYKNVKDEGTDANKYKVYVPIATTDEDRLHTYKITATDTDSGNNHTVTSTYQFYIDNTAPVVGKVTSTATGENEFKSGDDGVRSAYDIKDSNGQFNLSSPIEESGSGFERTVFYFVRKSYNGTTLSSRKDGIIDPFSISINDSTPTKDKTLLADLVEVPTDSSQPPLYGKSITGKVTADARGALVCFTADTAADISGNSHIREGGLVYVDGVFKRIESITGGVVTLDSVISGNKDEEKTAVFIYAQVVDNGNTETVESLSDYGFNFKNSSDDNDGMPEVIKTMTGGVTWGADIRSSNMADGPVTVVILAFDKAGNVSGKEINTYISNNAPRIAKVYLGTNIDRSKVDSADSFTQEEFVEYNWKEERGTMTLKTADYVNGLEKPGKGTPFTIKQGLAVVPEVIGGNSSVKMVFKKDADSAAPIKATSGLGALRENTTVGVSTAWMKKYDTGSTGRFLAYKLTNADLNGGADPTVSSNSDGPEKKMSFTFWDETEDTTQGSNSQNAVLYVTDFTVDLVDEVKPTVVVNPFYWNKINDNSIQGSGNVESVDKLNGHIELESDIVGTALNAAPYTPGAPKISGKVVFTGTAYDNQAIGSISAAFANIVSGDIATYVPATGEAEAKWEVAAKTLADNGYAVTVSDAGKTYSYDGTQKSTASESDQYGNWKDSAYFGQEGHKVYWTLTVDSEKLEGIAKTNVALSVLAKDLTGNITSTSTADVTARFTDADGGDYTRMAVTDGTSNVPGYTVDVVPYVTKVETVLGKTNSTKLQSRSALGHYPVHNGEDIKFFGYNLSGAKYVQVEQKGDTPETLVDLDDSSLAASNIPASGSIRLKVGSVYTINNINNDNATGTSGKTISEQDITDGVLSSDNLKDYAYNRKPNSSINLHLTDDIVVDVWSLNSKAALPETNGMITEPVMRINPTTGGIGFAFANGPAYFSMANGNNENLGRDLSYTRWQRNYDDFAGVDFVYDSLGNTHGLVIGRDVESNSMLAGKFTYITSKWGNGKLDDSGDNYLGDNKVRLETIGLPAGVVVNGTALTSPSLDKTRIRSPSIAVANNLSYRENWTNKTAQTIYMAYYDNMQQQIRFRWARSSGTKGDTVADDNTRADRGQFTEHDGNSSSQWESWKGVTEVPAAEYSVVAGTDYEVKSFTYHHNTTNADATPGDPGDYYGHYTGKDAGEYLSLAVIENTPSTSADDVVVLVWYDGYNTYYSYKVNPCNDNDAGDKNHAAGADGYWEPPIKVFSGAGEFCKIAVGKDKSIHIAAATMDAKLVYAYMKEYNTGSFETSVVDANGLTGTYIGLDTIVSENGHVIPYISYYMQSMAKTKIARLVDSASSVDYDAEGADDSGMFTGNWEVMIVPTTSRICQDNTNIGFYKYKKGDKVDGGTETVPEADEGKARIIQSGDNTAQGVEVTNQTTSYFGKTYGNGTKNPVVAYAIKSGSIGAIETAQMK